MTESFRAGEIVERKLDGKIVYATSFERMIRYEYECTCTFRNRCFKSNVECAIPEAMLVFLSCEFTHSLSDPHVFVEVEIRNADYPEVFDWDAVVAVYDEQNRIGTYEQLNKTRTMNGAYLCSGWVPFSSHRRKRHSCIYEYEVRLAVEIHYVRKLWSTMEMYGSQYEYTRINNFKDYFGNEEFSDVSIICNDNTLPAHRIILIRQSEYFDAMITHGFREGIDAVISLHNHNFNMIRNIVHFMYTEELIDEVDENNCHAIYQSAVYFGVTGLKKYLIHYFIKSLNRDNIYTILRYISDSDELKTALSTFREIHNPLTYEVFYGMHMLDRWNINDLCQLFNKRICFFGPFAI